MYGVIRIDDVDQHLVREALGKIGYEVEFGSTEIELMEAVGFTITNKEELEKLQEEYKTRYDEWRRELHVNKDHLDRHAYEGEYTWNIWVQQKQIEIMIDIAESLALISI